MIELTTSAIMLATIFYGGPSRVEASAIDATAENAIPMIIEQIHNEPMTLEQYIKDYFKNTPELVDVAYCESSFRHFGPGGIVLRGEVLSEDVGVMQINETYHLKTAKKLGYDIYTVDGNLGYAKYLYEKQGMKPWNASKKCWNSKTTIAKR